jgi:predicted flap endonuclease-1-like 5' DNA nuclease
LIEKIEGIGLVYAQKLLEVGIKTTDDLLNQGKSRKGREELVEKTGISSLLILKWVNMADLMRIKGVGEEYSELLERAGVDTVKELRNRNPNSLYEAMSQANETLKIVRRLPKLSDVESWVREAKESEPLLTY